MNSWLKLTLAVFTISSAGAFAQEPPSPSGVPQPPEVAAPIGSGSETEPPEVNEKASSVEAILPEDLSPEGAYQVGIKSFQEKKYNLAKEAFKRTWQLSQENVFALFNWGLSEFYLGNLGMAAAAWRKALFLSPDFGAARQALDYVQTTSNLNGNISGKSHWETFRNQVLNRITIHQILSLTLISLLASGWLIVRYLGRRTTALNEELPMPPLPTIGLLLLVLFLVGQTISALKIYDHLQPRATIIKDRIMVHSAPTETSSELFELYGGVEVILKRSQDNWSQVRYPGGLTGWVKNQWIFHTSGREI